MGSNFLIAKLFYRLTLSFKQNKRITLFPLSLFIFFSALTFLLFSIHDYGETYDEAFYRCTGEAYLGFFRTFDFQPISSISVELPTWAGTLGAFFTKQSFLFPEYPDTDRFHLVACLSSALALTVVFNLTFLHTKSLTLALFSTLLLLFYPQFFIHSYFNSRDMMLMAFYILTIFLLFLFQLRKRLLFLFLAALTAGFTFDIKFNAIFLIPIACFFFFSVVKNKGRAPVFFLAFCLIFAVSVILFWPYLWLNTVDHLIAIIDFLRKFKRGETVFFDKIYFSHKNIPWFYPFVMLALFTPFPMLLMTILGIGTVLKDCLSDKKRNGVIFLLWMFVPLSRFFFAKMAFAYDQIRIFLEVLPSLAVFAAIGFYTLFRLVSIRKLFSEKLIKTMFLFLGVLIISHQAFLIKLYHPYETAYFNFLAGPSVYVNHAFDVEYWGHVYRETVKVLKNRYPEETVFYMPGEFGYHLLMANRFPYKLIVEFDSPFDYVIFMNRKSFWYRHPYLVWLIENKKPVFTIERERKVIFYQFRPHKKEYLNFNPKTSSLKD